MAVCPACGADAPASASECPQCHLSVALFSAVTEAAGPAGPEDPEYVRTIAELIQSVDLPTTAPAAEAASTAAPEPIGPSAVLSPEAPPSPIRTPEPLRSLPGLPALPTPAVGPELRRRAEEYEALARRLDVDVREFSARVNAATLTDDGAALDVVVREMFVHLASALTEEFDSELARRNELSALIPTPSADVEINAVRRAMMVGDLPGAHRRLVHVHDDLVRIEEEWATGRILITACDLLSETIRFLGGDPAPALGPLHEGRRLLGLGKRDEGERLLARSAYALWAILAPRFFADLQRLRDRILVLRDAGVATGPALTELRGVATELRRRNFVGTIACYRQLRSLVTRTLVAPPAPLAAPDGPAPGAPGDGGAPPGPPPAFDTGGPSSEDPAA